MTKNYTKDDIIHWFQKNFYMKPNESNHSESYYVINEDLTIDFFGDFYINSKEKLDSNNELPFQFGKITGRFTIYKCELASFKNFPYFISETLNCSNNHLENLDNFPQYVGKGINLTTNRINSLKNLGKTNPNYELLLGHNKITSLEGLPEETGSLMLHNNQISCLKFLPKKINGSLVLSKNNISNIENINSIVTKDLSIDDNPIVRAINCSFNVSGNIFFKHKDEALLTVAPENIYLEHREFQKIQNYLKMKNSLNHKNVRKSAPKI